MTSTTHTSLFTPPPKVKNLICEDGVFSWEIPCDTPSELYHRV